MPKARHKGPEARHKGPKRETLAQSKAQRLEMEKPKGESARSQRTRGSGGPEPGEPGGPEDHEGQEGQRTGRAQVRRPKEDQQGRRSEACLKASKKRIR